MAPLSTHVKERLLEAVSLSVEKISSKWKHSLRRR